MPTTPTEIDVYQIRPGSAYQLVGTNSGATQDTYLTLAGTSNEVIVTPASTTITLSTPQAIGTTSSPTFQQLTLGSTTLGGLVLNDTEGSPKSVTIEAPTTITSSYTLKFPIAQSSGTQVLTNDGSGNLSWSAGGGGGVGYREDYVVGTPLNNYTGSLTVFNLVNPYNVGGHTLVVTLDGDVQTVGASVDYLETNSTTVTFNYSLVVGQKVSFIFSQPPTSPSGIVNSGTTGQIAYYASGGTTVSGESIVPVSAGGTGLSSVGSTSQILSTSSSSALHYTNQFINVLDYGADNTGATDTTTALQNALNAGSSSNRTVYLPAGRYKITDTLQVTWNYGASYPNNLPEPIGVVGDGMNQTIIEWWGTSTLQTVRKAMMYVTGGWGRLENFSLVCPRQFGGAFASSNTPYYGIVPSSVGGATFWKIHISHVGIYNAHVPLSINIIKTYTTSGGHGLEFEPASGGITFPAVDTAQMIIQDCWFQAQTYEFFDGTLNALTQNNANGTNLLKGQATTVPLESAAFSDGSYVFEIGGQASVAINFDTCNFYQINVGSGPHPSSATATIRLDSAGQILFNNCLMEAPPSNNTNYTHSIFEYVSGPGSDIYCNGCYFIGGIFYGSASNGVLKIKNCNGENFAADNTQFSGVTNIITGLFGTLNHYVDIDGLDLGRSDGTQQITIDITAATSGVVGLPFGNNLVSEGLPRYQLRNITGVTKFVMENLTYTDSILADKISIFPDLPQALVNNTMPIDSIPTNIYRAASSRTNMAAFVEINGKWLYNLSVGSSNNIEPRVPITSGIPLNISVDVFVQMLGGHTVSELNGDITVVMNWYNSSSSLIVSATPVIFQGTTNYFYFVNSEVVTVKLFNIIPPTNAAYFSVQLGGTPNAGRVNIAAIGNVKVWDCGTSECAPWIPTLTLPGQLPGTATNDSALVGNVGEYVVSSTTGVAVATSNQWGDITSIALTAGDWDVWGEWLLTNNGSTCTAAYVGIGTTSGNNTPGSTLTLDYNQTQPTTASYNIKANFNKRISLSGSGTAYLKTFLTYTVATPNSFGTIFARRVR